MRRGQLKGQQLNPIARWETTCDGEILLMDTLAMTMHLHIGERTVRRYPPVACDLDTRAPLWDALAVGAARQNVKTRAPRTAPGWRLAC